MVLLSSISLPKPKDWHDFERKTRELFACALADPNTQMNGRSGQPQNGVDIWGHRNEDRSRLVGVQCKRSVDEITIAELETELEKAKSFQPPISEFILVTTAPRDAKIQKRARELTENLSRTERPVFVALWGWEDIEEQAAKYAEARDAFDPTFNPYAKRAHQETLAKLDDIAGQLKPSMRLKSVTPFILPQHETASFTGREDELKTLERALLGNRLDRVCTIAGLSGTGGIGKSALAVHFATVHRHHFPSGVIGLRVDGKDNDTIAREFARNAGEIIDSTDERDASSIMQSVFGDRAILLIFDNAEDASLRSLIPGGRSSVIVTTRDRGLPIILEVPEASRVDVPALAEESGLELLKKRLGTRVDAEIDVAKRIITLVGGLPLALQIVASRLEMEPWRQLAAFADILDTERQRLSALAVRDDPHLDVRISFNASLKFLKTEEIDFFACLSVCDADSFAVHSAAATSDCPKALALERLGYLYRLSLLNRPEDATSKRFVLHPLLRSFAGELADLRGITELASERHARYFIELVKMIGTRGPAASAPIEDDVGEALTAAKWLVGRREANYEYLICLEPLLARYGFWHEAVNLMGQFLSIAEAKGDNEAGIQIRIQQAKFLQLRGDLRQSLAVLDTIIDPLNNTSPMSPRVQAMFLNTYAGVLHRLGRFEDAAGALAKAGEVEERLGNERGQAMVFNSLGGVLQRLGKFQEAADALAKAGKVEERLGNQRGQAMVLNSLGGVLQRSGKFQEAAEALQRSYKLLEEQEDDRGQAMVLNSLGGVLQRLGEFQEAAEALAKAGEIEERIGNERGQAMVLNSLGGVLQRLGKFQEAANVLERSKTISEQMGDERSLAMVLNSLGGVLQRLGKFQEAADALERSKTISEQMGDERSLAMVLNSLGGVLQRSGKFQEAETAFRKSCEIGEKIDDNRHLAMVLNSLGGVLQRLGKFQEAANALERSKTISEQMGDERSLAMVLNSLGGVLQRLGKFQEAANALERSISIAEQQNDELSVAMRLNSLGGVLQRLGKFQEAANALERSISIAEHQNDEHSVAMRLNSLGGVLQRSGKFQEAADALQRSHDLLAAQGDERGQAMVLNSLGGALQRLRKVREADEAFVSSINLGEKLKDRMHLAKVRTAYGRALVSRGDLVAGVDQLREGFLLDERSRNRRGLSIVAPLLVNALLRQGKNQEANEFRVRALVIAPDEEAIQRLSSIEQSSSLPATTTLLTGKIKRLLESMGRPRYGFFKTDLDGSDVYFSEQQIGANVFSSLSVGMLVEGDVVSGADGRRQAVAVRPSQKLRA